MTLFVGLDIDGVYDFAARIGECRSDAAQICSSAIPAVVVQAEKRGEALTGHAAGRAVEGRAFDSIGAGRRELVFHLWSSVIRNKGVGASDLQKMLAAHLASLTGSSTRRTVLAIPDPLGEGAQEQLLALGRAAHLEVSLLWRPVAVLLGLDKIRHAIVANPTGGEKAFVLHIGACGVETTVLELDLTDGLLTPVRSRAGLSAKNWPDEVALLAKSVASELARYLGWDDDYADRLVKGSPLVWHALLDLHPVPDLVRRRDGRWVLLDDIGDKIGVEATADLRRAMVESVWELIAETKEIFGTPDRAIVEGTLLHLEAAVGQTFGDIALDSLEKHFGLDRAQLYIASDHRDLVAVGGAEYARRDALGLPTYFDFLPQIEINALRHRKRGRVKSEFVPLIRGQRRIPGGKAYKDIVKGFAVGAGTEKLKFYLAYEGEDNVRELIQPLEIPPSEDIEASLVVRQKPASGRARVEVHTSPPAALGVQYVLLDWDKLTKTSWTKAKTIEELEKERGFTYPDCAPIKTHWRLWDVRKIHWKMSAFIRLSLTENLSDFPRYVKLTKNLVSILRAGRLPQNIEPGNKTRYAVVDTFGNLPKNIGNKLPCPREFDDFNSLYESFREKISNNFKFLIDLPPIKEIVILRRQHYLAGAWLYGGAPKIVRKWFIEQLKQPKAERYVIQAIGRSFSEESEIKTFFNKAHRVFKQDSENNDWVKAVGQILIYREGAERLLDDDMARTFLIGARKMLESEVYEGNVAQKFFNASFLLLGLLRYRIVNPNFLFKKKGDPIEPIIRDQLETLLTEAVEIAEKRGKIDTAKVISEVREFLKGKGTNQLIAGELDEMGDSAS